MRNKLIGTGIAILVLVLMASLGCTAGMLTAADILDRMESAAEGIEDLNALISVQTYKDGAVSLTQQMRLTLKQPDSMRLEYLEPEYLAGNVTLIVGEKMWMYIAAIDKWFEKDLAELSSAEQPWLMFRNILHGVSSMLDDYTFTRVEDEGDTYHIHGLPASDAAVYGKIDLWVDPDAFLPLRRILYDVDGNLLVDARFLDATAVSGVTLPLRIETYNGSGELVNVISYVKVAVNEGVPDDTFASPEGSGD